MLAVREERYYNFFFVFGLGNGFLFLSNFEKGIIVGFLEKKKYKIGKMKTLLGLDRKS